MGYYYHHHHHHQQVPSSGGNENRAKAVWRSVQCFQYLSTIGPVKVSRRHSAIAPALRDQ
ncbi:hypothetical protein ZHAS_00017911 [Anopheles sinensis]|uniref:Uncharacterized protein n=1 Tax=Anopheles sinensis TaxID=74873 RepID=A0A084WI39_ANOSI|nr:hypothetical protein ZHAS_00017911 [Anopheles sinensis]